MLFSSVPFLFYFLPCVLLVYFLVPGTLKNGVLLLVSLLFYGWGEPVYILLMVFSIALNYAAGLLIARYRLTDDKKARAVLTVNTVVNLALLIFFKYFDLLAATLSRIPGINALRNATPEDIAELEMKYPDAAFALMISDNLFVGDRELNEIHQKAYTAILSGESISGVRFRYDFDTESYLRRHMWD